MASCALHLPWLSCKHAVVRLAHQSPDMSVSCSRMIGGGRGGVVSVCTEPGGVTLRRAVEMEPDASRNGLCMLRGVLNSTGCSLGSVNKSGG
jgi:hypothetical protein